MKYSIKILTALFTFIFGISAFVCWNFYSTVLPQIEIPSESETIVSQMFPTKVSICRLDDSPDSYDGKWIMTEATVYASANDNNILHPIDCYQTSGDIHWTFVELKDFKKLYTTLRISKPYYKEVDVRVIGTAKKIYNKYGEKNYLIVPDRIEILSPFRKFIPRSAA